MDRGGGYRRAFEKCRGGSDLLPASIGRGRGLGNGFGINGIRCWIGLESESLRSKKR